jgi:hypothetical protein
MRSVATAVGILLLVSSTASAQRTGMTKTVRLSRAHAPAGASWNEVVHNLKALTRDRGLRGALRANRGSIVLGETLVPDRKYPGVSTLKQLVINRNGLVIHSRIGNHVDAGNGTAAFIPLPNAKYKGSTAVRFSRFGIPFFTEWLRPGEWGHLAPDAIRSAALNYKLTSAVEEAQRLSQ